MRIELKHTIKPDGAREFNCGKDFAIETTQWLDCETVESEALKALIIKAATVAMQSKIRTALGNYDSKGKPTAPDLDKWEETVLSYENKSFTPEFLTATTSKRNGDAAVVEAIVQKRMAKSGCTREEAIAWIEENM